jgi:hypothetical protein
MFTTIEKWNNENNGIRSGTHLECQIGFESNIRYNRVSKNGEPS